MKKLMKSQALIDNFKKLEITLYPLTGEETAAKIDQVLNMDPVKVQQLKKLLVPN